jgi:hypothetical protein
MGQVLLKLQESWKNYVMLLWKALQTHLDITSTLAGTAYLIHSNAFRKEMPEYLLRKWEKWGKGLCFHSSPMKNLPQLGGTNVWLQSSVLPTWGAEVRWRSCRPTPKPDVVLGCIKYGGKGKLQWQLHCHIWVYKDKEVEQKNVLTTEVSIVYSVILYIFGSRRVP